MEAFLFAELCLQVKGLQHFNFEITLGNQESCWEFICKKPSIYLLMIGGENDSKNTISGHFKRKLVTLVYERLEKSTPE